MTERTSFEQQSSKLQEFERKTREFLEGFELDISAQEIDHLCIRYRDPANVDALVQELVAAGGTIISDKLIAGRAIYIVELAEPVTFMGKQVPCLEIPYPKNPHQYDEDGWEHFEVVIPGPFVTTELMYDAFRAQFPGLDADKLQEEGILTVSEPKVDSGKQAPNPHVTLEREKGFAIKFHPMSIKNVVNLET